MKEALDALFSKDNRKFFFWGIGVVVVVLAIPPCIFMYIFGGNTPKLEFIKLIGWGMSGLIAILGVMGLFQRAAALDKQNEMTEESHIQERFNKATEHLGHDSMSVRIAAFNAFCHLVEIKPDWRQNIFDILCAHLRQTTKDENYQKEGKTSGPPESAEIKPTEEVQSLLNILFKPDKDKFIFDGLIADLEGVYLQGANLQKAKLIDAKMQGANLQRANLQKAKLIDAKLIDAKMQHAFLIVANLQKARLWNTKLQNANLQGTDLQYADLKGPGVGMEADIEGVDMSGAKIYHALMPEGWEEKVKENDVITQKWP